jgi:hypothetical protein
MAFGIILVLIVAFGLGPAVALGRRGLITNPIEHLGNLKHASILLIIQSLPLPVGENNIFFLLHPLPLGLFPHLPLISIPKYLSLFLLLPQIAIGLSHQLIYGFLIDLLGMFIEVFKLDLLPASLVLDLLLVEMEDVAHVTLTHAVDLSLFFGRVPEGHR